MSIQIKLYAVLVLHWSTSIAVTEVFYKHSKDTIITMTQKHFCHYMTMFFLLDDQYLHETTYINIHQSQLSQFFYITYTSTNHHLKCNICDSNVVTHLLSTLDICVLYNKMPITMTQVSVHKNN